MPGAGSFELNESNTRRNMEQGKDYQGWNNYETWAVALWIDNDRGSYEHWREQTRRHRREAVACPEVCSGTRTGDEAARIALADALRQQVTEAAPLERPSVYADLLRAALDEVDWHEIAAHLLDEGDDEDREAIPAGPARPAEDPDDWPVIFAYTRAQAIDDGVLVDVSEMAREAGFRYPVALTAAVWQAYVAVPEAVPWQDENGRLWDILTVLRVACSRYPETAELRFSVLVQNDSHPPRPVQLKACCGPGDQAEPVLTVMLPDED